MKILMTGNPAYGLAQAYAGLDSTAEFASRSNGYDLTKHDGIANLVERSLGFDVFVNSSALHEFWQTKLLYKVWERWKAESHVGQIINIGSTIDFSRRPRAWQYSIEKKALFDASLELGGLGVWDHTNIRITYLSFGSLNTPKVAAKHVDRTLMDVNQAAQYIRYVVDSPKELNINVLHVDPMQK